MPAEEEKRITHWRKTSTIFNNFSSFTYSFQKRVLCKLHDILIFKKVFYVSGFKRNRIQLMVNVKQRNIYLIITDIYTIHCNVYHTTYTVVLQLIDCHWKVALFYGSFTSVLNG